MQYVYTIVEPGLGGRTGGVSPTVRLRIFKGGARRRVDNGDGMEEMGGGSGF